MKFLGILGLLIFTSFAHANNDELVKANTIVCEVTNSNDHITIGVDYYRTTGYAGPGNLYINDDTTPFSGGWSIKMAPENTRLAGFTEFSFKSGKEVVSLILDGSFNTGWGNALINGKTQFLDCKFN